MAQLAALIVSQDEEFHRRVALLLRAGTVPVWVVEQGSVSGESEPPDIVVIDIRRDLEQSMVAIEKMRAGSPALAIFAMASAAEPGLILQAMRAGANEFFAWPAAGDGTDTAAEMEQTFHGAVQRTAARRETVQAGTWQPCVTLAFLGAKGGAGTTTLSVNCAVELARLTKRSTLMIDLKESLGQVTLFLGVRPRFTVLDAIDNLHRLDRDFLRELVAKHKSGLDILAGTEQFDRPAGQDAGALEELLRMLARIYDFIVIDAGNVVSACIASALYASDIIFLVASPDVPSIRNAQRLVDRVRQLGAGSERVRVLLNRASEQSLIAPKQIEAALGLKIHHTFPSDYRTVEDALNAGVPLALTNHSTISAQFNRFTRQLIGQPDDETRVAAGSRRAAFLGLF